MSRTDQAPRRRTLLLVLLATAANPTAQTVVQHGLVLFSLRPLYPTWLGAGSCTAWFAFGNAAVLDVLTTPSRSTSIQLPNVPQFAGIEVALQSYYAPTNGPLMYDLSNGLWARVGY